MARTSRVLLTIALTSLAASAIAIGCADSTTDPDGIDPGGDASRDARKDSPAADTGNPDEDEDSGPDGSSKDAGRDAAKSDAGDAGSDAKSDASSDAGSDAKSDASEGGADASTDAGMDATSPVDAGDSGTATVPAQGDVVISEVMYNPTTAEPGTEWIELYNTTTSPKALGGLVLKDGGGRSHTIAAGLVIAPGAYAVLANDTTAAVGAHVPATAIIYDYDTLQLGNGATGEATLFDGATEIARAKYGPLGLTTANGASVQLKTLTYTAAGTATNWCISATVWTGSTDKGTPGAASDCP